MQGKRIFLTANEQQGYAIGHMLSASGAQVYTCDGQDLPTAIAQAEDQLGGIDALVHCASYMVLDYIHLAKIDDFDAMMQGNYLTAYTLCKHFVPHMAKAGGGTVVLLSSDYAIGGVPRTAAFAASVGALLDLTAELTKAYPQVRTNAILQGVGFGAVADTMLCEYGDTAKKLHTQVQLIGRQGTPQDILEAILYLSSDRSDPMRGQHLLIDGGIQSLAHPFMK